MLAISIYIYILYHLYINNNTDFSVFCAAPLRYLLRTARARAMRAIHRHLVRHLVRHIALGYGPTYLHGWKDNSEKDGFLDPPFGWHLRSKVSKSVKKC